MENIKTLKVYSFAKKDGTKLSLFHGRVTGPDGIQWEDEAQRWMIRGEKNPIPVRNGTWFQGFSFMVMRNWLKSNGWAYQGWTATDTGHMHVASNANEWPDDNDPETAQENSFYEPDRHVWEKTLTNLWNNGKHVSAARLYRFVYNENLRQAMDAIREIVERNVDETVS